MVLGAKVPTSRNQCPMNDQVPILKKTRHGLNDRWMWVIDHLKSEISNFLSLTESRCVGSSSVFCRVSVVFVKQEVEDKHHRDATRHRDNGSEHFDAWTPFMSAVFKFEI